MPVPNQSPRDCLELLDNAVAQLQMDRPNHARCQLAVRTLEQVVTDYESMRATQAVEAEASTETRAEAESPHP